MLFLTALTAIVALDGYTITGRYDPNAPAPPGPATTGLTYYPAHARISRIEGEATVTCFLNKTYRTLSGCLVNKENPQSEGFGGKAVELAVGLVKITDAQYKKILAIAGPGESIDVTVSFHF